MNDKIAAKNKYGFGSLRMCSECKFKLNLIWCAEPVLRDGIVARQQLPLRAR
jgi:hypothetical protein